MNNTVSNHFTSTYWVFKGVWGQTYEEFLYAYGLDGTECYEDLLQIGLK
jgi:hypothetical protein